MIVSYNLSIIICSQTKKYYHFIFDLKSCESCDITYKYIIYNNSVDS
jgi:hypothetical protein